MTQAAEEKALQVEVFGEPELPAVVYLPGLHGDCTISHAFREEMGPGIRFVEFTYPRNTTWSMADYGSAVADALDSRGIESGWVIGESFGSQVLWALVAELASNPARRFKPRALFIGGGFVRFPVMPIVWLTEMVLKLSPVWCLRRFMGLYQWWVVRRSRGDTRKLDQMHAFLARRNRLDLRAIIHRLRLIQRHDPRTVAAACRVPVYHITGRIDIIVPWIWVRPWLRKNCRALAGEHIVNDCDHVLFFNQPAASARQITAWMAASAEQRVQ